MKRLFTLLLFFTQGSFAQEIEGEIELAGFVLGQYRNAVHAQLGPPLQRKNTKDGWIYEFHKLKPDTSVYALFKYTNLDTTKIYSIQISGDDFPEMNSFMGLKLGAKKDVVNHRFGKFDRADTIDDPPIVIQYYSHKNYSVEIDNYGYLCGIQIFGNILNNKPKTDKPSIRPFHDAVISKNIDSLIHTLSPDIELIKGGSVIRYSGAAREEFKNPDSEFVKLLLGETGSAWYVFAKERAEGSSQIRIHSETNAITGVDKFFDSNIIEEIVFKPHAGKWKVFEIKYR